MLKLSVNIKPVSTLHRELLSLGPVLSEARLLSVKRLMGG